MAALRSPSTRIRLLLAALVLAAAVLVVVAPVFMLAMAPAIALFAMVANRVMPGADAIVRLVIRGETPASDQFVGADGGRDFRLRQRLFRDLRLRRAEAHAAASGEKERQHGDDPDIDDGARAA